MKPTQEQVEAAKKHLTGCGVFNRDHSKAARWAQADRLAEFLAARDADRDARWEEVKRTAQFLVNLWNDGWTNSSMRDAICELNAALADLGAEEKHNHDGYCEKCAKDDAKPEPKCLECGDTKLEWEQGDVWRPCSACQAPKCGECKGSGIVWTYGDTLKENGTKPCPSCAGGKP